MLKRYLVHCLNFLFFVKLRYAFARRSYSFSFSVCLLCLFVPVDFFLTRTCTHSVNLSYSLYFLSPSLSAYLFYTTFFFSLTLCLFHSLIHCLVSRPFSHSLTLFRSHAFFSLSRSFFLLSRSFFTLSVISRSLALFGLSSFFSLSRSFFGLLYFFCSLALFFLSLALFSHSFNLNVYCAHERIWLGGGNG